MRVDSGEMLVARVNGYNEVARTVIGLQRDSFGDRRDMQVDVEVTGSVLPFLESTDNGSGDIVMRSE